MTRRNVTQQRLDETKERYNAVIKAEANLQELLEAIQDYDKKNINKTFFEKYFSTGQYYIDGRPFTKYRFRPEDDIFNGRKNVLMYEVTEPMHRVDIYSLEKNNVEEAIRYELDKIQYRRQDLERKIEDLEGFSEEEFYKDLEHVFNKHGKPDHWPELVEHIKYDSRFHS